MLLHHKQWVFVAWIFLMFDTVTPNWHINGIWTVTAQTKVSQVRNQRRINSNLMKHYHLAFMQRAPPQHTHTHAHTCTHTVWCALFCTLWQWVEVSGGACWSWKLNKPSEVAGFHVAHCAGARGEGNTSAQDKLISDAASVSHTLALIIKGGYLWNGQKYSIYVFLMKVDLFPGEADCSLAACRSLSECGFPSQAASLSVQVGVHVRTRSRWLTAPGSQI